MVAVTDVTFLKCLPAIGLVARTMRRAITFVLYLALIIGGSWAIYGWLVSGARLALFAAFLALFSASLLWADLLSGGRERKSTLGQ